MSDNVNRADVQMALRDVFGQPIKDDVEVVFKNQKVGSLSQKFTVKLRGTPEPTVLPGLPAFPVGLAQVTVIPKKYRIKSFFFTVFGGVTNAINEVFFVDAGRARPTQMDFQDLAAKPYAPDLLRILKASGVNQAAWDAIDKRNRATILNLCAKMQKETTKGGQTLLSQVQNLDKKRLDKRRRARIFSSTDAGLMNALRKFPERFRSVSGALHTDFPAGFTPVSQDNSFKSLDSAGNIQLTFFSNTAGAFVADIDLDDHTGIQHAADVLKHRITGEDTDPYDIHQILAHFQSIDPGYRLL